MSAADAAEQLLAEEELDSGIVVARGSNLRSASLVPGVPRRPRPRCTDRGRAACTRARIPTEAPVVGVARDTPALCRHPSSPRRAKVRAMLQTVLTHVAAGSLAEHAQTVGVMAACRDRRPSASGSSIRSTRASCARSRRSSIRRATTDADRETRRQVVARTGSRPVGSDTESSGHRARAPTIG